MYKLYLDDKREAPEGWIQAYNYTGFIGLFDQMGVPDQVSFDHDLGMENPFTGMDCAQYMVEYCIDIGLDLPVWTVHSANPVGRDNIIALLKSGQKQIDSLRNNNENA